MYIRRNVIYLILLTLVLSACSYNEADYTLAPIITELRVEFEVYSLIELPPTLKQTEITAVGYMLHPGPRTGTYLLKHWDILHNENHQGESIYDAEIQLKVFHKGKHKHTHSLRVSMPAQTQLFVQAEPEALLEDGVVISGRASSGSVVAVNGEEIPVSPLGEFRHHVQVHNSSWANLEVTASRRGESSAVVHLRVPLLSRQVDKVPILAYHEVGYRDNFGALCLQPETFAHHMAYLYEQGYQTISFKELQSHWQGGLPITHHTHL